MPRSGSSVTFRDARRAPALSIAAASRGGPLDSSQGVPANMARMSPPIRGFLTSFRVQAQIRGNPTGFRVQVRPRTQIPAHFPRFSTRLNTRPCDFPLRGDFTGLRGQAALQVPGGAGNPESGSNEALNTVALTLNTELATGTPALRKGWYEAGRRPADRTA